MVGMSDRVQQVSHAVETLIADYDAEKRIQELSLELIAELVSNKTGLNPSKDTIAWHLYQLGIQLKTMKTIAKYNRVKEIIETTTYPIQNNEIRDILLAEKFTAGVSATSELVARIRKEMEKQSGKARMKWEADKLKEQVAEAIHYIENHLFGKVTCPKIAHYIRTNHDVIVSDHIINKVRKGRI